MRKILILGILGLSFFNSCEDDVKKPIASFTVEKTIALPGETILFYNNSQHAISYEWNFDDGTATISDENPRHSFSEVGSYTVTLKAIGEGGSNTSSTEISVEEEARIFPGSRIDQYYIGAIWSDVIDVIASDYYFDNTSTVNSGYLHTFVMESEQLAIYFDSTNPSQVQDTDPLFFVSAWGNYKGRTPTNLKIGSTLSEVYDIFGIPEIENGNGYIVYYYFNQGILFYSENDIVLEIDIFPPFNNKNENDQEYIKFIKQSITQKSR